MSFIIDCLFPIDTFGKPRKYFCRHGGCGRHVLRQPNHRQDVLQIADSFLRLRFRIGYLVIRCCCAAKCVETILRKNPSLPCAASSAKKTKTQAIMNATARVAALRNVTAPRGDGGAGLPTCWEDQAYTAAMDAEGDEGSE
jgi:hypothetical protein